MTATLEPVTKELRPPAAAAVSAQQTHLFSVDFLRFYATMQVLLIHTSGPFAAMMMSKSTWWAGCLIDSFARPAVPIFFMISGMLLLEPRSNQKDETTLFFLKRRFTRVFLPLLAWSAIYLANRFMNAPGTFHWHQLPQYLSEPACYHLGFLYQLGGLYLGTPILRAVTAKNDRSLVKYFVGLWFVSQCIVPEVAFYIGWTPPITFQMMAGSVGTFLLGYLLRDVRFEKKQYPLALGGIAICLAGIISGTYFLTMSTPNKVIIERFYEYHHPLVVIYAALTFILLRSIKISLPPNLEPVIKHAITAFAAASFTIYLAHPLYLDKIQQYTGKILNLPGNKFILCFTEICLTAVAAAGLGWLFYAAARKLKLPTWLVP